MRAIGMPASLLQSGADGESRWWLEPTCETRKANGRAVLQVGPDRLKAQRQPVGANPGGEGCGRQPAQRRHARVGAEQAVVDLTAVDGHAALGPAPVVVRKGIGQ